MINFGKYKGKYTLMDIAEFDLQYICWIAENIPSLHNRLDNEDKDTLKKLVHPIQYLEGKYGEIKKR